MATDPFVVHVARLRRAAGSTRHEQRTGPVDPYEGVAPPGPGDSVIPPGQEVTCDVRLEALPDAVMVTGTVTVPWQGVCRRCTVEVGGELMVPVRERFVEGDAGDRQADGWGDGTDDEAYRFHDDLLDLGPMVHDAVVMELPSTPLCREDCRGLCPTCGTDLNVAACRCVAPRDPRWASLYVLRSDLSEAGRTGDRS